MGTDLPISNVIVVSSQCGLTMVTSPWNQRFHPRPEELSNHLNCLDHFMGVFTSIPSNEKRQRPGAS